MEHACVFSKETVRKISNDCKGFQDSEIYECMTESHLDAKDEEMRDRFFPRDPKHFMFHANSVFATKYHWENCCSKEMIVFHDVWGPDLLKYNYFFYKVQIFGTKCGHNDVLPNKLLKVSSDWDDVVF